MEKESRRGSLKELVVSYSQSGNRELWLHGAAQLPIPIWTDQDLSQGMVPPAAQESSRFRENNRDNPPQTRSDNYLLGTDWFSQFDKQYSSSSSFTLCLKSQYFFGRTTLTLVVSKNVMNTFFLDRVLSGPALDASLLDSKHCCKLFIEWTLMFGPLMLQIYSLPWILTILPMFYFVYVRNSH